MVVMRIFLDNFFGFKDFSLDFSYPKKIVNSTIEEEYLAGFTNFRYKKINIIMGANATGKTTLGKAFMSIFSFIAKKESNHIISCVDDTEHNARFSIDYIPDGKTLCRVDCQINAGVKNDIPTVVKTYRIKEKDNYETSSKALDSIDKKPTAHVTALGELEHLSKFGWYFTFPNTEAVENFSEFQNKSTFTTVLKLILKTMDTSVDEVVKSKEMDDSYIIRIGKHEVLLKNNALLNGDILSSGTKSGIDISLLLSAIISHEYGFYYCDEKYTFIQSDLEKELLSIMITRLGKNEQMFFTTHNTDVLDMNLPKHSYLFLKKESGSISSISADSLLKRNTDNLKNAVENNLFSSIPDTSLLNELETLEP